MVLFSLSLFCLRRQHNLIHDDDGNVGHIFFCSSFIFFFSLFHFPFNKNLAFSSQDSPISFTLQACVFYSIISLTLLFFCVIFLQFCVLFQVMMLAIQTPRITPFRLSVIAASPFPLCPKYVFSFPKISTLINFCAQLFLNFNGSVALILMDKKKTVIPFGQKGKKFNWVIHFLNAFLCLT